MGFSYSANHRFIKGKRAVKITKGVVNYLGTWV